MNQFGFWCIVSLILCSLLQSQAQATPLKLKLDQKTKSFLRSTSTEPSQLLLLYRSTESSSGTLSLTQKVRQTKAQETLVFGTSSLSRAKRETIWLLNGTIASLTSAELERIIRADGGKIIQSIFTLSRKAHIPFAPYFQSFERNQAFTWGLDLIGLPGLRQAHPGLTGKGVRLGLIDTGIEATHRDLKGRTLRFRNFLDSSGAKPVDPFDDNGHGSHVAGTMVGGSASRIAIGVAPEAGLVVAKAFSAMGSAQDAHLLLALQWMADPDNDPSTADGVRVINNSWNFNDTYSGKDPADEPFCLAIEKLEELGILTVFSSGNSGPGRGSVQIPGSCPKALTVGATDESDSVANFSSRGPVQWRKVQVAKPELVAPGVEILSVYPGMYINRSGTSMAAPHVTGVLALLVQKHPELSPIELKKILIGQLTKDVGTSGPDAESGQGRLDLAPLSKIPAAP